MYLQVHAQKLANQTQNKNKMQLFVDEPALSNCHKNKVDINAFTQK